MSKPRKQHIRFRRDVRKQQILDATVALASRHGYANVTKPMIASACDVSTGTVNVHFGTMHQLRRAVIRQAVARQVLPILAQAMAARDPLVSKIPQELRTRAAATLAA